MANQSYANEFTSAYKNLNLYLNNPYMMNEVLKKLNMNPNGQTRDDLLSMVQNPKNNEKALRQYAQYLYNVQMPFKRLAHYYANMLTFDLSIYPTNATEQDMKTDEFKRQYEKNWKWLNRFDHKKEFQDILLGMMVEDAKFMYLRDDEIDRIGLQEMPTDYCLIDSKFNYGWLYSFDLNYFSQQGVDIDGFAPEFKEYYNNYMKLVNKKIDYIPNITAEMRNGRWTYWQQINPKRSWVFKFHSTVAGLVPPLLGLFVDASEIDTYKNLQSTKSSLDIYKLLIGIIPFNKNKNGTKADDLAISASLAGEFNALINSQLPDSIKFATVPFEDVKAYDFSGNAQTKDDIVGDALKNFYNTSGSDQALFNAEKPNATTMKASLQVDSAFISSVYKTFESFLDYQLSRKFDRFNFKTKLTGTIFDKEERFDRAIRAAEYGILTPDLPGALGLTEKELRDGLALMKSIGYPDVFKPLQNTHTMPSEDTTAGRPVQDVTTKTDKGEETTDQGTNIDKTPN